MSVLVAWGAACAIGLPTLRAAEASQTREWTVDGAQRQALIYAPATAKTEPAPLVFAFHGHGGSMQYAARKFRIHERWPEAIVVYMQGLPTPGRLTDPDGKRAGWQSGAGDQHDRDLHFFDAVLKSMRETYKVDENRIYCTGHSNGGGFTYLLWANRGDTFAAYAPAAALSVEALRTMKPAPMLHVAGEKDPLVKFEWQQRMIDAVRKLDRCEGAPQKTGLLTTYPSPAGTPVETYIHPGGHELPDEAVDAIVTFFKSQTKGAKGESATRPVQKNRSP